MVRQRTSINRKIRVKDVSGGLFAKMDSSKLAPKYFTDVRNMRFASGVAETRPGNARAASLTRPSGAMYFPGSVSDCIFVPWNSSCPIWSGLRPPFTVEFVAKFAGFAGAHASYDDLLILEWGSATPVFGVRLATGKNPSYPVGSILAYYQDDSMVSHSIGIIGEIEIDAGDPEARTYYFKIRRDGRDLDALIVGGDEASLGWSQYTVLEDVFTNATVAMKVATDHLFIGGTGLDSLTLGAHVTLDEIRITGRLLGDTRKTYWTSLPMAEDPDLLLYLPLNDTDLHDESLYGNDAELVDTVTLVDGLVEDLMIGQLVTEHSPDYTLHRLVGAGGSVFREAVR